MHSVLICDTPSNDGQQCYQVSSISIKAFKIYGPDMICRQTDKVIPIYPLNFVRGGYNEYTSLNIDVHIEIIMHVIGLSCLTCLNTFRTDALLLKQELELDFFSGAFVNR